jgi:hypothetical protein
MGAKKEGEWEEGSGKAKGWKQNIIIAIWIAMIDYNLEYLITCYQVDALEFLITRMLCVLGS